MKTYCKPGKVNIESVAFNSIPVHRSITSEKLQRRDYRKLLVSTGKITEKELAYERIDGSCNKQVEAIDVIAETLTEQIQNRTLTFSPMREFQKVEGINMKTRDLAQECPEQQICEHIAVYALMPLFNAKILPFQYGSIPGRGQEAGKRKIERILRRKFHNQKLDCIKCDIKKAYPSVTTECVMQLLRRDIHKNKPLLWFMEKLMENYPDNHLVIGGYMSTWLFNYVMSYVLRYLFSLFQSRRGVRHNMVWACVCYADDFALFGRRSNLRKAIKKASRWTVDTFGLSIKPGWDIVYFSSIDDEKTMKAKRTNGSRQRTQGLDMMGFVVRRTHTIVRGRIFVRIRRQVIRARRNLDSFGYIPWWRAVKLCAYWGWLVGTDSQRFRRDYTMKKVMKAAKHSVSLHGKKEAVKREQRILRSAA